MIIFLTFPMEMNLIFSAMYLANAQVAPQAQLSSYNVNMQSRTSWVLYQIMKFLTSTTSIEGGITSTTFAYSIEMMIIVQRL